MDTFVLHCVLPSGTFDLHVLNIICHGTNYHICVSFAGIHGGGGSEDVSSCLDSSFWASRRSDHRWGERVSRPACCGLGGQRSSSSHHPWQNGRVERHGGWIKERLEVELQTGTLGLSSWQEIGDLLVDLCAAKNQFLNRGAIPQLSSCLVGYLRCPGNYCRRKAPADLHEKHFQEITQLCENIDERSRSQLGQESCVSTRLRDSFRRCVQECVT